MLTPRDPELRFEWHGAPRPRRYLFLNNRIRGVKLRCLGHKTNLGRSAEQPNIGLCRSWPLWLTLIANTLANCFLYSLTWGARWRSG